MPVPTVPPHRLVGDIGLIDDHNLMVDVAVDAQTRLAAHDTAIAAGATSASVTAEATARASAITAEATARIAAVAAKADGLTGIVSSHALSNGSDMAPTINAELAALPSGGGVLKLPAGILTVNTPLSVPASMTLQGSAGTVINNTVATTSAVILGAGSSLIGGTIMSPATFDGTTGGTWTYAVVYITGAGATVSGVTFINVPHIGIGIKDTDDAVITNCRIFGNYPSGSYTGVETAHFAINLDPGTSTTGGNLVIGQNIIKTCVQGTFIGNHGAGGVGRGVAITGNTYESCWNHGVYADQGEGYVISTNNFNRCQNPVVVSGTYHSVVGNTMTTANTGTGIDCPNISVRDAIGCVVVGNTIQGEGLASGTTIDCRELVGVELRDNIIANNIVDITGSTGVTAIRCGAGHATIMQNNSIIGNHVRGIGVSHVGLLGLYADATILGQGNKVIDNTVVVTGPAYGITLSQQTHADVRGNHMRLEYNAISTDTLGGVILTGNSVKNRIVQNDFIVGPTFGTNITYRAIWEVASSGTGNNRIGPNDYDLDPTLLTLGVPMLLISGSGTIINESGTGAPTVGASVSSMWRRTDGGTQATTLYIKETGTGTTGWRGLITDDDIRLVSFAPDANGTDDTTALNAMFTTNAGAIVRFKPGQTYKVSAPLVVATGTKVDLTGTIIQQLTSNTVTFSLSSVADVSIRGGKILGKGTDYVSNVSPTAIGVTVVTSTDISIEGCRFENHAGAGVKVDVSSVGVMIARNRIKGTGVTNIIAGDGGEDGIRCDGSSSDITIDGNNISDVCQGIICGNTVTDLTIVNNKIHDIQGQHGMYIQNSQGLVNTNNRIRSCNISGIKLQLDSTSATDSGGAILSYNNIDTTGVTGAGIIVINTDPSLVKVYRDLTVNGNTIRNSAIGMQIADVRCGVVADNSIGTCSIDGLRVYNSQDVIFANNVIHDITQIGINVLGKTNGVIARIKFRGNQVRDAATAGTTSLNYGIRISDGTDVTLDANEVTASHANMIYGIYFSAGDQASAVFRNNYSAGANAYGARLISATNVREWTNNNVSGTTGAILNPPPNASVGTLAVSCDIQTFATAGTFTWTMPIGAKIVRAEVVGGGSGGGSGRRGAAGTVRCGGGGGGGAARSDAMLNAADLAGTVTVVVGAAGTGGSAQTSDSTDGSVGGTGGDSRFGDTVSGIQIYGRTGNPGGAGTATSGTSGATSIGMFPGCPGAAASTTGGVGVVAGGAGTTGGGGSGGGITSGDTANAGGAGSVSSFSNIRTVTTAGTVGAGQNGAAGSAAPVAGMGGDGGGGGAASITGAAGTGGAGGIYGAGGGGGGASLNGNNSGAGGAGGSGFVRITSYF